MADMDLWTKGHLARWFGEGERVVSGKFCSGRGSYLRRVYIRVPRRCSMSHHHHHRCLLSPFSLCLCGAS